MSGVEGSIVLVHSLTAIVSLIIYGILQEGITQDKYLYKRAELDIFSFSKGFGVR